MSSVVTHLNQMSRAITLQRVLDALETSWCHRFAPVLPPLPLFSPKVLLGRSPNELLIQIRRAGKMPFKSDGYHFIHFRWDDEVSFKSDELVRFHSDRISCFDSRIVRTHGRGRSAICGHVRWACWRTSICTVLETWRCMPLRHYPSLSGTATNACHCCRTRFYVARAVVLVVGWRPLDRLPLLSWLLPAAYIRTPILTPFFGVPTSSVILAWTSDLSPRKQSVTTARMYMYVSAMKSCSLLFDTDGSAVVSVKFRLAERLDRQQHFFLLRDTHLIRMRSFIRFGWDPSFDSGDAWGLIDAFFGRGHAAAATELLAS